jgi:hypothetical protein
MLVFTNPVEGREEEFNDWYDNVHIPDTLRTEGFVAVTRYELAGVQPATRRLDAAEKNGGETTPSQRYLAVWELEGDLKQVFANVGRELASGRLRMSDVVTDVRAWVFTAIRPTALASQIPPRQDDGQDAVGSSAGEHASTSAESQRP